MKKLIIVFLAGAVALLTWSFISAERGYIQAGTSIENDAVFLVDVASSGMLEVQLGQLAMEKGASREVKDFGAMMVRDHSAANAELKSIASRLGVTLPDTLLRKDRRHFDHVRQLSGNLFDRAYANMMVEEHKDDIDEFEDASQKARDTAVRGFATRQLPILKMHREQADALQKTVRSNRNKN